MPTNSSPDVPHGEVRPTHSTPQVLLGILIVWQILFLLGDNALHLLFYAEGITEKKQVGAVIDRLGGGFTQGKGHWYEAFYILKRWEGIWNTPQSWRMFSPSVGDYFSFIRVEMRWDDLGPGEKPAPGCRPPVVLKGLNEPDDFDNYVRWGPWRFQRYEDYFLGMDFHVRKGEKGERDETAAEAARRWKKYIQDQFNSEWKTMNVYLNWRWRKYHEEHLDCPKPRQLILSVRTFVVGDPEENLGKLSGPTEVPVVRWEFHKAEAGKWGDLQPWDPVTKKWQNQ
jgi:hypothetical protein